MMRRLQFILGATFFLLMFVYIAGFGYRAAVQANWSGGGWFDRKQGERYVVTGVKDLEAEAGLRVGDELIAINNLPFDRATETAFLRNTKPDTPYTVIVRRGAEVLTLQMRTRPVESGGVVLLLLMSVFVVTGFVVFLLKPYDKQALLLGLMLGTFIAVPGWDLNGLPSWLVAIMFGVRTLGGLFPVFLLHLFLVFPKPSPLLRRYPRAEYLIYVPALLLFAPYHIAQRYLTLFDAPQLAAFLRANSWLNILFLVNLVGYVLAALTSMIVNYRVADRESKRRMRVAVVGSGIGFSYYLLLLGVEVFGGTTGKLWEWGELGVIFALPLIPLSFAYAIVRHKVIPVSLIIRQGVRYLLVKQGFYILQAVLIFFVISFVFASGVGRWVDGFGNRADIFATFVASGLAFLFAWSVNRKIVPAIDRRFFREAYDAQTILSNLSESVRSVTSTEELLESVATNVQHALHTGTISIFLLNDESGEYRCALFSAHGGGGRANCPPQASVPVSGTLANRLREATGAVRLDFSEVQQTGGRVGQHATGTELGSEEREALKAVDAELLLGLKTKSELLGFVALGAKLNELPFSGDDERLLLSVANQTSFALENARLVERMIEEERRRREIELENEQRAKELEEARQLQLSMLPQTLPQLPGLEIAAYMKTATEVGGDYYDFHVAEDGTLTVAIGDATGHGLKAGTMVTAAKSLFRTFADEPESNRILMRSTGVLKAMNLRSLFMAMTILKISNGKARVSTAGMPPLLVCRAASGEIEEVAIRGVPLGCVAHFAYPQREIELAHGDSLVLMSDGFPERFNTDGEMFDYQNATNVLKEVAQQSPLEIINHFLKVGEEWANGKPQDDDITFVVLRFNCASASA